MHWRRSMTGQSGCTSVPSDIIDDGHLCQRHKPHNASGRKKLSFLRYLTSLSRSSTFTRSTCAESGLPLRWSDVEAVPSALFPELTALCVLIWPVAEVKRLNSTRPERFPRNSGCLSVARLVVEVWAHLKPSPTVLRWKPRPIWLIVPPPPFAAVGWHHPFSRAAGSCQSFSPRAEIASEPGNSIHWVISPLIYA